MRSLLSCLHTTVPSSTFSLGRENRTRERGVVPCYLHLSLTACRLGGLACRRTSVLAVSAERGQGHRLPLSRSAPLASRWLPLQMASVSQNALTRITRSNSNSDRFKKHAKNRRDNEQKSVPFASSRTRESMREGERIENRESVA